MPLRPGTARARWLALLLVLLSLVLLVLGTAVGSVGFENLWPALSLIHI